MSNQKQKLKLSRKKRKKRIKKNEGSLKDLRSNIILWEQGKERKQNVLI